MKKIAWLIIIASAWMTSCKSTKNDYDASGAFESVETIVSTEATGTILQFNAEEGQTLNAGVKIGYVDTAQLYLKKVQLEAQASATESQQPDIPVQVASLQAQLSQAQTNQQRIANLMKADAATQKDMDDANTQVEVLKKQIAAQQSTLSISSNTISRNVAPLQAQIAQVNDELSKSYIINPVRGTVLTKYAEAFEVAAPGKALYKIAPLDTLILRAYLTESQLSQIKLGQQVKVRVDSGENNYKPYTGTIYWISTESEFTPKTIQTKDERADLVYAIKVRVPNDGYLKIGMYGEVKF